MTRKTSRELDGTAARQGSLLAEVAVCGLVALLAAGCQQDRLCEELGDCGGEFLGNWALSPGHESCSEDLYEPPTDKRLTGADIPAQRIPPPEPALSDWCGGLITGAVRIQEVPPLFFSESAPYGSATMRYNPDGTYALGLVRTGTFVLDFSATCMRQFGATDGKPPPGNDGFPDPALPPTNVCKQLEVPLNTSGTGEGAYRNMTCVPNPDEPEGCLCYFDVSEVSANSGTYTKLANNEILHTPTPAGFAYRMTYCRKDDSLELTASDDSYIAHRLGLRTLELGFVNCMDGVQGPGEEGVDCGSACGNACP